MKMKDIPEQEIIDACNAFHSHRAETPDVELATKYPPKLVVAKMEKMIRKGILDCGVSARTAWVRQ
jgi:hypothetical protein